MRKTAWKKFDSRTRNQTKGEVRITHERPQHPAHLRPTRAKTTTQSRNTVFTCLLNTRFSSGSSTRTGRCDLEAECQAARLLQVNHTQTMQSLKQKRHAPAHPADRIDRHVE